MMKIRAIDRPICHLVNRLIGLQTIGSVILWKWVFRNVHMYICVYSMNMPQVPGGGSYVD